MYRGIVFKPWLFAAMHLPFGNTGRRAEIINKRMNVNIQGCRNLQKLREIQTAFTPFIFGDEALWFL